VITLGVRRERRMRTSSRRFRTARLGTYEAVRGDILGQCMEDHRSVDGFRRSDHLKESGSPTGRSQSAAPSVRSLGNRIHLVDCLGRE
jgi:hypothetical protein